MAPDETTRCPMIRLSGPVLAIVLALVLSFQFAAPARAQCQGENVLADLPREDLAAITAAANSVPYPKGNFWRATRGDEVITIAGTYHLSEPRHQATIKALAPQIQSATTVLVEAGPEEEKALMDLMARDPSLMVITEGPTLYDQLPPEVWEDLSQAMADRGIPAFMAAKFRPWYVMAVLSIPPCAMAAMDDRDGLDQLVIDTARAANVPVRGLEPFDTIFTIFGQFGEKGLEDMLISTLAMEDRSEDFHRTLVDSYFSGESRLTWELMRHVTLELPGYTPERVETEFAEMEEILMNARNRAWIPVLTRAAAEGPVFAAFGALHLSGKEGVLNLLEQEGFTIEPLDLD